MSRTRHLRRLSFRGGHHRGSGRRRRRSRRGRRTTPTQTPNPTPTSSRQIENLGLVKNAIRSYYGDTVVNGVHQASATSPYAHEIAGDEQDLMKYLRNQKDKPHTASRRSCSTSTTPAC